MLRLWALSKAAPALLQHVIAYIELAGLDLATAERDLARRLIESAIIAICTLIALLLGCLAVVAWTWDTQHRVAAIVWMAGGFLVVAVAAAFHLSRISHRRVPLFAHVRQEWQGDRISIESYLSEGER
jgi:uncharacterized membrane protein YqjE